MIVADFGTTLTGVGTLGTIAAVITGVILNLRKRPSDELLAQATARAAEDSFYTGRLDRAEREHAEEEAGRKAAEERVAMLERDLAAVRRAKDDDEHRHRMQARELREHVARLEAQLRGGAEPVG